MIYEGLVDEGLEIVRALRARYDGIRRNPWDEIECGHHYARALASWSLVQAMTGARYSAVEKSLTFASQLKPPFRSFVALGAAWGELAVDAKEASLEVHYGEVTLALFGPTNSPATFDAPRTLRAGERVAIALR